MRLECGNEGGRGNKVKCEMARSRVSEMGTKKGGALRDSFIAGVEIELGTRGGVAERAVDEGVV